MKNKTKLIRYSPATSEKIRELKEHIGLSTDSAIIILGINLLHEHTFDYAFVAKQKSKISPLDKAKARLDAEEVKKEEKEKREFERQLAFLKDELSGELFYENGFPMARYLMYCQVGPDEVQSTPMTMPLESLNQDCLVGQYQDRAGRKGPEVKEKLLKLINKK